MKSPPTRWLEGLILVAILVLAFFMASIPHLTYEYPLHIDEWMRYGGAQSVVATGHIVYPSPFQAGETVSPDEEIGFHLLLGELQMITGVSWLNLFRFLPGIILALLALQAYVFCGGGAAGLAAAFLAALIPTTVRFLGPAFLVPVALGLSFIPLTLVVLTRLMSDIRGPVILFLVFLFLLFMHPPTLAVVSVMALVYLIFFLSAGEKSSRFRQSMLGLASVALVYVFMLFWAPAFVSFVVNEAASPALHLQLPPIQGAVAAFGYIPAILFSLGVGILAHRGGRESWALVLCAAGLLAYQLLYPHFYIGPDIVYERGWLYVFVFMALLGAEALVAINRWVSMLFSRRRFAGAASRAVVGIVTLSALVMGLRSHLAEPYYHIVDDVTYQDFRWVREYVPAEYQIGVLDTAQAWAFADISGKFAYASEVAPNFHPRGRAAMEFLDNGARDALWLSARNIGMVYGPGLVENNRLMKVNHNMYLLVREEGS
ncbi:MAG: hypothetical protein Q8O05_05585 [Chloroflexota bacterium]|nr:hypothetical protein [Chloroflexota bacterium]